MSEIDMSILCTLLVPFVLTFSWLRYFRGLEYVIINYRWIFVCLFLLPLSAVYDCLMHVRAKVMFALKSAPKQHGLRVANVQRQVLAWNSGEKKTKMCTARPGWATMSFRRGLYKNTMCNIDVNLIDILDVDVVNRTVVVEPLVTMGQITACLNPLGWTLPVLPELDDLTVGGLIMGVGIETSSHKYGLFQHNCVSFEIVTADGSLVQCSKDENADLFYAIPWSHGTLGFLVAAKLNIVPAKQWVKIEYRPVLNQAELGDLLNGQEIYEDNEFVEALVYSRNKAVLMTGNMVDEADPGRINAVGNFYKPWFYKHVERFLNSSEPAVEYIPLRHYYHRHTRSIFWMMKDIIPFGNHPLFRFLCGWLLPPKVSLLKLTQGETIKKMYEKHQIIQDMLVPMKYLVSSLEFFHQELDMYPLWICPFMLYNRQGLVHPRNGADEMYVDIGAYGTPRARQFSTIESTRKLEDFVGDVGGFQMLYADSYLSYEQFRKMFHHSLYYKVRRKLKCDAAFPEIYDKASRSARI